jgi:dihydroneopterin aldolase
MFERFTQQARRVVVLAQEEARYLDHDYIGTEHLMLGLIADEEGVAARVLRDLGIEHEAAGQKVVEIIGRGEGPATGHIRMTPRAKKVLELSLRESIQLKDKHIGPEHILLGLLREGDGVGAQVLVASGADLATVREKVLEVIGEAPPERSASLRRSGTAAVAAMATSSNDEIRLTGISVRAHHGVYPEEQEQGQEFVVDLVARLDLSAAGESDRLEDTVDYGALAQKVHDLVATERWNLLERVAEKVAELVLDDGRVREVEVTVHKPQAPMALDFSDVSVMVRRCR